MKPFLEGLSVEVVGGLVVFGILAVGGATVAWLRHQRVKQRTRSASSEARNETETLAVLREQVVAVANARGISIAIGVRGTNPAVVTYANGGAAWFYRDLPSYKRGLEAGHADPRRSVWGKQFPNPVSRWDEARLRAWLDDHAN